MKSGPEDMMRDVPGGVDISRQRRLWHWPRSEAPKSGNAFVRLSHFCGFFLDGQTPFMEHMKASIYSLFLFLGECTPVSFSKGTLSQTLGLLICLVVGSRPTWFIIFEADLQRWNGYIWRKTWRSDWIHLKEQPVRRVLAAAHVVCCSVAWTVL